PMYLSSHPDHAGVLTRQYSLSLDPRTGRVISFGCDMYEGLYFNQNLLSHDTNQGKPAKNLALKAFQKNFEEAEIRPQNGKYPRWSLGKTKWRCEAGKGELEFIFDGTITPPSVWGNWVAPFRHTLPIYLHLPDHGLWRITGSPRAEVHIAIDVPRKQYRIFFKSPDSKVPLTIEAEAVNYYPLAPEQSPWYDHYGVRKGWLSAFPTHPGAYALGNDSMETCHLRIHLYPCAAMASVSRPLPGGFHLMEVVRNSIDLHLGLRKETTDEDGYFPLRDYCWLDGTCSLLVAAYFVATHPSTPKDWLKTRWPILVRDAEACLAHDLDGDGILETKPTGNTGSKEIPEYPWDLMSIGWKVGPINAVAYRAFNCMASLARRMGEPDRRWEEAAQIIKAKFKATFYNPDTGVLAAWRSRDGELHDYEFTWANMIPISEGLINQSDAGKIMWRMLSKIKAAGFKNYQYGVPTNIAPIPDDEYLVSIGGGGEKGFQEWGNGSATFSLAHTFIWALRQAGLDSDADRLMPEMLVDFGAGRMHHGVGNYYHYGSATRSWDGRMSSQEGFLIWPFHCLLFCVEKPFLKDIRKTNQLRWPSKYSLATAIPAEADRAESLLKEVMASSVSAEILPAEKIHHQFLRRPVVVVDGREILRLKRKIQIAGRYKIEVGGIIGKEFGGCRLLVDGCPLWDIRSGDVKRQEQFRKLGSLVLHEGEHVFSYEGRHSKKLGLEYMLIQSTCVDICSDQWNMIGPMGADSLANTNNAFDEIHDLEKDVDLSRTYIDKYTGCKMQWRVPDFSHELVNFRKMFGVGTRLGVGFAVTYIHVTENRRARISFGADYYAKMWVNKELVVELGHATKRNTVGAHLRDEIQQDVLLRKGRNEVLVKLQSGSTSDGFWFSITDPGDLKICPKCK
ncbi:MAG: hypothetical protein L6437_08735, partial [Kiritimatiellae bacterium]|nr:hypothetical protein [Kiritimatiellia bacterium]